MFISYNKPLALKEKLREGESSFLLTVRIICAKLERKEVINESINLAGILTEFLRGFVEGNAKGPPPSEIERPNGTGLLQFLCRMQSVPHI